MIKSSLKKPVNVLAPFIKKATIVQLAEAGAKRISGGGALARAAMTALINAGQEMQQQGSFGWTANLLSGDVLQKLL